MADNAEPTDGQSPERRRRTLFTEEQRRRLESYFLLNPYPDAAERRELADLLDVKEASVLWWFGHRRARDVRMRRMRTSSISTPPDRERDYYRAASVDDAVHARWRAMTSPPSLYAVCIVY